MIEDVGRESSSILREYEDMFPNALPDAHQISDKDLMNLPEIAKKAMKRGSPIEPSDFDLDQWMDVEMDEVI